MSKKGSPLCLKLFMILRCTMSPNDSNGSFNEFTKRYDTMIPTIKRHETLPILSDSELPVSHLITPHLYHQMRANTWRVYDEQERLSTLSQTIYDFTMYDEPEWFEWVIQRVYEMIRYDDTNNQTTWNPSNPFWLQVTHQVISRMTRLLIWEGGRQGVYTCYWRTVWFGFNLVLYYWWWISLPDNLLRRCSCQTAF
jgi:hypothetical protein